MRQRFHVFYAGRVQGVGFRFTVREVACGYEVAGYVRNLMDGRVELAFVAETEEAEAFLEGIRQSALGPHIHTENVQPLPSTGELKGFEIRY